MRAALVLLVSLAAAAATAQDQPLPLGRYVNTSCFSGTVLELKPEHRFETEHWTDLQVRMLPVHPAHLWRGARGRFRVRGDTVLLAYEEIVLDLGGTVALYGDSLVWAVPPDEWSRDHLARVQERSPFYLVHTIDAVTALVPQDRLPMSQECRAALQGEGLRSSCSTPRACRGILLLREPPG